MNATELSRLAVIAALLACLAALAWRLDGILHRPRKRYLSRPGGSRRRGVLYAFTLGMAPWEKESARKHWVAYVRGVVFHVGVFVAFAVLLLSPWFGSLPLWLRIVAAALSGAGAVAGFSAAAMRWADRNQRSLSVPDDYFAVALTALFAAMAFVAILEPVLTPVFYLVAAVLLLYIPFGKIRHCIYFFYAKFFYGAAGGHRGVLGGPRRNFPGRG